MNVRWIALGIILATFFPVHGRAEFIFKKDGAIIKGKIVSDEATTLSVKKESGAVEQIYRKDIMRIIYTELYLGKVYARLTSGEVIEGYQIDEDRDSYFFRKNIYKPEEFTIPRKKVMFIARTNPTDLKGFASTEQIKIEWSPPFKPAKYYKIYVRDVKGKEEKFTVAGETADLTFKLKKLRKSWSYELYATAISDTGEESLPSEKIVVNTLPNPPEKLVLTEALSKDGKKVTLTFSWKDVADPESRVKSYVIHEIIDEQKKKQGSSAGGGFVIKDYLAEGRHYFSLAAVNDLGTESDDLRAIYDAGYKIYARATGSFLYPMGIMHTMASSGFGCLAGAGLGLSGKNYSFGLESGLLLFNPAEEIKSMIMIPVLLEIDYRIPLVHAFSFRLALKAGGSYDMIQYLVHDKTDPLITSTTNKSGFDPMVGAGGYLHYTVTERMDVFCGADYSAIFQKSGRMMFMNFSFGAERIF